MIFIPNMHNADGSAVLNHYESSMSKDNQTKLYSFCQTPGVKPQFSFNEDTSTGYYARQVEEEAARRLISEETSQMVSSRGAAPTAKIWKSELKEYYDKTGRAGAPLKYTTKECPKNGYQCILFAPDIGYVRGDICRSKSEAEHNAAYIALQKLKSD